MEPATERRYGIKRSSAPDFPRAAIAISSALTAHDEEDQGHGLQSPTADLLMSDPVAAAFDYRNEQGELLYQVVRFEPTGFTMRRPDGNGGWIYGLGDVRQVLYRLPELVAADPNAPVFLVEDERDADRLVTRELVATTNPGGADVTKTGKPGKGKWRPEFNSFLRDRRVVIVPRNHDAGREHAWKVAEQLLPFATQVRIVELPGVRPGESVSQFFTNGGNREQLLELVEREKPLTPLTIECHKSQQAAPNIVSGGVVFGPITGKKTQADLLIQLALDGGTTELFQADNVAYARVKVGDHDETIKIPSDRFRLHLRQRFHRAHQAACGNQAVETAIKMLSAMALFDGARDTVFLRVAANDRTIFVDLCDEQWRAIEITREAWRVISNPPVKFRRARGMLVLFEPVRGGSVDELRRFLNVSDDDQFRLAVSWLIAAIAGRAPFPVLILHGEQGAAKSTAAAVLRRLCDPNVAPLRAEPREKGDLIVTMGTSSRSTTTQSVAWLRAVAFQNDSCGPLKTRRSSRHDVRSFSMASRSSPHRPTFLTAH